MANALTHANLYSQAWKNVWDLITDRTKVADPLKGSSDHRKFVYSREPDTASSDFKGYPFVIVHPAKLTREGRRSADAYRADIQAEIEVEVFSSDKVKDYRTTNNPEGKGLDFLDDISDDVIQTFSNKANKATLANNNVGNVQISASDVDFFTEDGERVYIRRFLIAFSTPMHTVST